MQSFHLTLDSSPTQFAKDPCSMGNLSQIINLLEEVIKMLHQPLRNS